jgi:hypothetical protein
LARIGAQTGLELAPTILDVCPVAVLPVRTARFNVGHDAVTPPTDSLTVTQKIHVWEIPWVLRLLGDYLLAELRLGPLRLGPLVRW